MTEIFLKLKFKNQHPHILLLVGVAGEVVEVGAEVGELERGVDDGPDGVHFAAVDALHPVGGDLHADAAEVVLAHPPADVVRRLQDQQVGDPGLGQHLPSRDP